MPYACGAEPEVGDIVESRHSRKEYDEIVEGEVYKVVSVDTDGDVRLRGQGYCWNSERFNLLAR